MPTQAQASSGYSLVCDRCGRLRSNGEPASLHSEVAPRATSHHSPRSNWTIPQMTRAMIQAATQNAAANGTAHMGMLTHIRRPRPVGHDIPILITSPFSRLSTSITLREVR